MSPRFQFPQSMPQSERISWIGMLVLFVCAGIVVVVTKGQAGAGPHVTGRYPWWVYALSAFSIAGSAVVAWRRSQAEARFREEMMRFFTKHGFVLRTGSTPHSKSPFAGTDWLWCVGSWDLIGRASYRNTSTYVGRGFAYQRIGKSEIPIPIIAMRWEVDLKTPGTLLLQPMETALPKRTKQVDLESSEFNRSTIVEAEPTEFGFRVLTPDFMHWYLVQPKPRPWLFVRDDAVTIVWEKVRSVEALGPLVVQFERIVEFLSDEFPLEVP